MCCPVASFNLCLPELAVWTLCVLNAHEIKGIGLAIAVSLTILGLLLMLATASPCAIHPGIGGVVTVMTCWPVWWIEQKGGHGCLGRRSSHNDSLWGVDVLLKGLLGEVYTDPVDHILSYTHGSSIWTNYCLSGCVGFTVQDFGSGPSLFLRPPDSKRCPNQSKWAMLLQWSAWAVNLLLVNYILDSLFGAQFKRLTRKKDGNS